MALNHVAQRTGMFVKTGTVFHAQIFGHSNLHVSHMLAGEQGFEYAVAQTQSQHILHSLFAQVVIDAVHLRFIQFRSHGFFNQGRFFRIETQWLFQHQAKFLGVAHCGNTIDQIDES